MSYSTQNVSIKKGIYLCEFSEISGHTSKSLIINDKNRKSNETQ